MIEERVYPFEIVTQELIGEYQRFPFQCDLESLALADVQLQLPFECPTTEKMQVILEDLTIFSGGYLTVYGTVICKKAYSGR